MQATQPDVAVEAVVARHARRNFIMLAADMGVFALGWTFASTSTILPAFMERLGASNLAIGAIPAVATLGATLPPLFAANYTERLPRKLPFILIGTAFERLPLLMLAAAAYLVAEHSPALAVAAVLLSLLSSTFAGGALMPAWMDVIGKVVSPRRRGRLFATGMVLGSGLGLLGTLLSAHYLRSFAFPNSYALCFLTGFLCLLASWVALGMVVEPAVASGKPEVGMLTYLRRLPDVLRRDRSFTWYVVYRCIGQLGGMAGGFYTVHALRTLGAPASIVATFTTVALAGSTAANLGLGWLADHIGHRPVLILGTCLSILGNVVAFLAPTATALFATFICLGGTAAAGSVSALNLSIEFAPDEERPTYVGLASTVTTPLGIAAGLIGGALADAGGYRVVFAVAACFSLVAVAVLAVAVRDPRHRTRAVPAVEAS